MPLVSVLIPYYNDEKYLSDSIKSVLCQTFTDFELILINHACTDSSRDIAHSFTDKRIVHVDLATNAGAGGGIILDSFLKVAKGDYYKLFCADDLMKPDYLKTCVDFLTNDNNVDFCFTDEEYIDMNGNSLNQSYYADRTFSIVNSEDKNFAVLDDYIKGVSRLPFSSVFIRKNCFDNVIIDYTMVMMFDMSLFLQFLLNGKSIGFLNDRLISYRIHEGQISSSANSDNCYSLSFFEQFSFFKLFFKCNDKVLISKLLRKNVDDIALELALYFLAFPGIAVQSLGYLYLHDYFQDSCNRLPGKYSVAEFRKLYGNSVLARQSLLGQSVIDCIGIKGLFKILMRKIKNKIFKNKLTHL